MRTNRDPKWRGLLGDMARAREAVDRADFEDARQVYLKLRAQCLRQGVKSAHLAWSLAVACDGQGDVEGALEYIREAIDLDPLALPYQRSYEVIVEHIRKMLADETRAPDDPTTPKLYELLVRAGEGDVASHLAMARHLSYAGDHAGALRLLDAVTTLAPASRLAWTVKAQVARAAGDEVAAREAEFEAAALDGFETVRITQAGKAAG